MNHLKPIGRILGVLVALSGCAGYAQPFASIEGAAVTLDNGVVHRVISLDSGGAFATRSLRLVAARSDAATPSVTTAQDTTSASEWIRTGPRSTTAEFRFLANDTSFTGRSGWDLVRSEPAHEGRGEGATLVLRGREGAARALEISATYLVYPDLPLTRKKLRFRNTGPEAIKLEGVEVESIDLPWADTHQAVYEKYGRYKHLGPFTGNWDDSIVVVHEQISGQGLVLGNEAPGVTKQTTVSLDGHTATIGLTPPKHDYPFRKWLAPGETWESPWAFIAPFSNRDPMAPLNTTVADFVRRDLGIRLAAIPHRPTFVYNTWAPFREHIDEKLMIEVADAAAECGVKEFVMDAGWDAGYGDWEIDRTKFPHGLKPVFDHMKARGMKPGVWISLASVSATSRVFKSHPEWFVRGPDGNFVDIHRAHSGYTNPNFVTACMASGWKDYIKGVILGLVREHGLEYVKLDLAVVTSAYAFDPARTGCYAKGHDHRDRAESMLEIYRHTWQLFDELHAAAPTLFIDCTFETMGALQLIDLDMCKHAEGNWLSNYEEPSPAGSLRVRQMAWWRSPAMPATALVIGNQALDDPNALFSFQSLAGALPMMLGDPRKLSAGQRAAFKSWSNWLAEMETKYQVMLFRQDSSGFGEPAEGRWDAFQRINTDTHDGGFVGVFRQGAHETERQVVVSGLDPKRSYRVRRAPAGDEVTRATGAELSTTGFRVSLPRDYDAALFEIAAP